MAGGLSKCFDIIWKGEGEKIGKYTKEYQHKLRIITTLQSSP